MNMNKRKKKQKRKAVNIENNSSSYYPILTGNLTITRILNSTKESISVV